VATDPISTVELTEAERRRLVARHPELGKGEAVLVLSGARPALAAVEGLARSLALEARQSERVLSVLGEDLDTGVLRESTVVQLQRQAAARRAFLQEFPAFASAEVARLGGSTARNTSALANRWKSEGKVFAVAVGGRDAFPGLQFGEDGRPLPAIRELLHALSPSSGWAVALWLASPSGWLGGKRPVDLLRDEPERVIEAARRAAAPLAV